MKIACVVLFLALSSNAIAQMNVSVTYSAPVISLPVVAPAQTVTVTTPINSFGYEGIKSLTIEPALQPVGNPTIENGRITQTFTPQPNLTPSEGAHLSITDQNNETHVVSNVSFSGGGGGDTTMPEGHAHHPESPDTGKQYRENRASSGDSINVHIDGPSTANGDAPRGSSKWWWLLFAAGGFILGKTVKSRK